MPILLELSRYDRTWLRKRNIPAPRISFPNISYRLLPFFSLSELTPTLLTKFCIGDFLFVDIDATCFLSETNRLELFTFLSALHNKRVFWCLVTTSYDWHLRGYFIHDFNIQGNLITNYYYDCPSKISP